MAKNKQDDLTRQQRLFCQLHHNNPDWSATECVAQAYPGQFKTRPSATAHGSRLLAKDKIQAYLKKLSRIDQTRTGASIGRIMAEEAKIAFYDPAELIDGFTREVRSIDKIR